LLCFVLPNRRAKRRIYWKGNQQHFEAAAVPVWSQSPLTLLLPVAIACCLRVCQKAALITASRRGGDVPVVPFWQSPGKRHTVGGVGPQPRGSGPGQWGEQGAELSLATQLG